jgi:hypothetical protein
MRHQTQIVRIATSLLLAVVVLGQGGTHVARADTRWTNLVIFAEVSERVPRQGGEWGRVLRVFITNEGTRDTVPTTTRVVIRMEDARRQWSAVSTYNIQTGALRPGHEWRRPAGPPAPFQHPGEWADGAGSHGLAAGFDLGWVSLTGLRLRAGDPEGSVMADSATGAPGSGARPRAPGLDRR